MEGLWIGLCLLSILCLWYLFVNLRYLHTYQKILIVLGLVLYPVGFYGLDSLIILVPYMGYVWWLVFRVVRLKQRLESPLA